MTFTARLRGTRRSRHDATVSVLARLRPRSPSRPTRAVRPTRPTSAVPPRGTGGTRGRRALRAVGVALAVLPGLVCLAAAGRTAQVALGTPDTPADVAAQVRHLRDALADGAAERMQGLFPEGYFFTHALTGLAAAAQGPGALPVVESELAALDSPAGRAPFPPDAAPAHGAFWTGWSLMLAVELARLRPDDATRAAVRERAAPLVTALRDSPTGFLESYPGQRWPVDTVVAVAALARADRGVGVPGAAPLVTAWTARTAGARDPGTGLLPHRLGTDPARAEAGEGPRGSSTVLTVLFERDVDPAVAARDYATLTRRFVTRELGWVGVREYLTGTDGAGDVDSGPLLRGLSLSASAVAIGTARSAGDRALALGLEREGELFGVPWQWGGRRTYAGGVLPIGEAFLAWARSIPLAAPAPAAGPAGAGGPSAGGPPATPAPAPSPLWWAWITVLLLPPAGVGAATVVVRARRRRGAVRA